MVREPSPRQFGHLLERAGLFEEVRGAGNDVKAIRAAQLCRGAAIEFDHWRIVAADDEHYGTLHVREILARQVRPSAARDDGSDRIGSACCRHQRRCRSRARAEETDGQATYLGRLIHPIDPGD